ncbi:Stk1 family PASTA domain-containing Ser/Thr kinase [Paucilactobacillus nenjiangensis]|uniref:Stk1 family PASTA domain-containing Ser/Thr kinase n=1 Tax=Paucilactobacillus nenjiangensis TaxID=1296540 RepID=UPI003FA32610
MNPGYKISGRYEIIRSLGEGGMANVYLAHDLILDRDVSVKLLRLDLRDDEKTKKRFQREALAATQLSNDHIVGVYDVGEEQGLQYMVMEYVEGTDLEAYIKKNFPIPYQQVIDIMAQILEAVEDAHEHNIIHRDLKPQNVLIDNHQQIKITDFGIAVVAENSMTQTNTIMGSVHYLSPEQARGGITTNKSDIYSLGIMLYEMLTGKVPFEGETAVSIALKHYQEETPSVREFDPRIPQALENVVLKATSKAPSDRYQTADAMREDLATSLSSARADEKKFAPKSDDYGETKVLSAADLEKAENGVKIDDSTPDPDKKSKKKRRRKRWLWLIPLVLIIGVVVWIALMPARQVIPDVSGMTESAAKSALEKKDLSVGTVTTKHSDTIKKDLVISSSPKAERKVKAKSKVNLVISSGVKKVEIQNYVGKSYNSTAAKLRKLGITVKKTTMSSNDFGSGKIMSQSVKSGTKVKASDTTITLKVSTGKTKITLPSFTGKTLAEVQEYANQNDLKVSSTEETSKTVSDGSVISQSPSAGSTLTEGDTISVVVAKNSTKTATETVSVPFDSSNSKTKNTIQIYLQDSNNNISDVSQTFTITSTQSVTLTLTLNNDDKGAYKIVSDGNTIASKNNITGS